MLSAGTLAIGLAYVGFAAAPSLAVACAAALLGGVGNGVQWASVVSAVQSLTPAHLLGRMMGALESLSAICPALGLSLGGALVAISSARGAFVVGGVGAGAAAAGFLWLALGKLESRPPTGGQTLAKADREGRGGAGEPAHASAPTSINVD
jgi:MFS family permease